MNRCVIDVGNTTITSALIKDGELLSPQRISTTSIKSSTDFDMLIDDVAQRTSNIIDEIVMCCGVKHIKVLVQDSKAGNNINFIDGNNSGGIQIDYSPVESLGPDRIANTIALVDHSSFPVLVVDCGTAITIDCIEDGPRFAGGLIAPGLYSSMRGLIESAPALKDVSVDGDVELFSNSTAQCIRSGTIHSAVGLIEYAVDNYKQRHHDVDIVITGGDGKYLIDHLSFSCKYDEWLTLKGLGLADLLAY